MASEIIGDPCFGLKASALWHHSYFGALAYAMLASNTLRATLERLDRYHRVISDEKFTKLDETEEGLRLTLLFSHEKRDIPERNDAALALILSMCRMNYVEDLAPVSVTFTHPMPSCSARFFEYFRSPVLFDAPADSLTLPIEAVDKHLPGSHPQLAELHDQIMIQYLARLDQEHITQQVLTPSGKVYTCWTSNQTNSDVTRDEDFWSALEEVADQYGMWIGGPDSGNGCDVFISCAAP